MRYMVSASYLSALGYARVSTTVVVAGSVEEAKDRARESFAMSLPERSKILALNVTAF